MCTKDRLIRETAGNDLAGAVVRAIRICGAVILSGLSAYGAAQLVLGLGLGADGATLAGIAAFSSNFFMIALIAI